MLKDLFTRVPELAIFLALACGYAIGKIRLGTVVIGGIAGTLIAAILIGQVGIKVDDGVRTVAFAIFIFALGFAAGPQFFANLNAKGLRIGLLSLIEVATILGLAMLISRVLHLDPGTSAGLMAGPATESAVLGTANEALGGLNATHRPAE